MKRYKIYIFMLFFFVLLCGHAQAVDRTQFEQQLSQIGGDRLISAMPQQESSYLREMQPSLQLDIGQSFAEVLTRSAQERSTVLRAAIHSLMKVLLVVILTACVAGFRNAAGAAQIRAVEMASALGIAAVLFGDLSGILAMCTRTLESISTFSGAMLPVMTAAVSLTGAPVTAAALQTATMLAFDLLMRFITGVLVPAVIAYITIITVNTALGEDLLGQLAHFVQWLITASLKLLLTVFIAYITLSGSLGGSVDGVTIKAAKFAVSGSVPVVGGIIADAAETMLSGALLLKNTVGIFGMVCITALCIVPFFQVGVNYLLFKAGTAVISPICSQGTVKLLSGISDSFGLLLGMLGTCSAVLFFELVFTVAMVKPA